MLSFRQNEVLLIRPYSDVPLHAPPLGLGYLASSLAKNKIGVRIIDCLVDNISTEEIIDLIRKEKTKIVGISCYTNEVVWVRRFASKVKSALAVKIIVGGPHPAGVMEKIFTDIKNIDFSIYSEGEFALPLLAKAILENDIKAKRLQGIPNLIWKNNNEKVRNFCQLPDDLDGINFPDSESLDPIKYSSRTPHGFMRKRSPFASIITTRGCPYDCAFCGTGSIHGKKLRKRSVANILDELKYLRGKFGIKEIFIEDDNFTFDPAFVNDLCGRIIREKLGLFFSLPNGICVNSLAEETLQIMRKANFYSFAVGIESGSPRILKKMGKMTSLEIIENKISMAKRCGFYITGFFIIGYPGETAEDINATIKFAKKLRIDKAAFSKYIPLPGTRSYNDLIDKGEIDQWQPFEAMGARDIPYSPQGISKDELRGYIKKAVKDFYFRPLIILRHIFRLNYPRDIKVLINIAKRFLLVFGYIAVKQAALR